MPYSIALRVRRKLRKALGFKVNDSFPSDLDYWDTRYKSGRSSGPGSFGEYRDRKWSIIEQYVDVRTKSVLDVGCGDLNFWFGRSCLSYSGIDFSPDVIAKDRRLYPTRNFLCANASDTLDVHGQVVLCMDVLFHVMKDQDFCSILRNLSKWTDEILFVYTWYRSPFGDSDTDGKYQKFRPIQEYLSLLPTLELQAVHTCDDVGALYVFKRRSEPT